MVKLVEESTRTWWFMIFFIDFEKIRLHGRSFNLVFSRTLAVAAQDFETTLPPPHVLEEIIDRQDF